MFRLAKKQQKITNKGKKENHSNGGETISGVYLDSQFLGKQHQTLTGCWLQVPISLYL